MSTTLPSTESRTVEVTFPVTDMTCASCVNRVEKAIRNVAGVAEASVNLATERATVAYDPAQTEILAQIAAAVERSGYGVAELPAEPRPLPGPRQFAQRAGTARAASPHRAMRRFCRSTG